MQSSLKYKLRDKIEYLGVFTSDHMINIQINKHRNKVIGFICNTLESTESPPPPSSYLSHSFDSRHLPYAPHSFNNCVCVCVCIGSQSANRDMYELIFF